MVSPPMAFGFQPARLIASSPSRPISTMPSALIVVSRQSM